MTKPESFFEEYAENAYNAYGSVTGNKNFLGASMPKWEGLKLYQKKAWIASVMSVFQKLGVTDVASEQAFVDSAWKPEMNAETVTEKEPEPKEVFMNLKPLEVKDQPRPLNMSELEKEYTGVLEGYLIPQTKTYDFIWTGGNEYVIIYNSFLEDATEEYVKIEGQTDSIKGQTLTITGEKHEYVLTFVAAYPELDVTIFKKVSEKTKEAKSEESSQFKKKASNKKK